MCSCQNWISKDHFDGQEETVSLPQQFGVLDIGVSQLQGLHVSQ